MSNPQGRNENILQSTLDGTEYKDPPQSRIEDLLLQLKEMIEAGGGGGGTTNYNGLTNKPKINGVELKGDKEANEFGLIGEDDSFTIEQISALKALLNRLSES